MCYCCGAAYNWFEAAGREFHASVNRSELELTLAVFDIHNSRTKKLEEYKQIPKHGYVSIDKMHAKMQSQLEASAAAAHNMFDEIMMRVMQPRLHQQERAMSLKQQNWAIARRQ